MGTLFWKNENKHIHLRAHALLGRSANCDIRIDSARVSSHHAGIQWGNEGWEVRDLGSRNGTFVDGRRLDAGQRMPVDRGAKISLARDAVEFELVDASSPGAVAINQKNGVACFAEGGILALPHEQNPLVTIFMNSEGEWLVEGSDAPRVVVDGEILDIDGTNYRVELPNINAETQQSGAGLPTLESITLHFAVTPDEEQVELTVVVAGHAKRLPKRRYHYLLVTLARVWIAEEGVANSMRGWVDRERLCRGLEMDVVKLGVEIYRARKQLADLGVQGAAGLIERRVGTCELRIGVPNLGVVTL